MHHFDMLQSSVVDVKHRPAMEKILTCECHQQPYRNTGEDVSALQRWLASSSPDFSCTAPYSPHETAKAPPWPWPTQRQIPAQHQIAQIPGYKVVPGPFRLILRFFFFFFFYKKGLCSAPSNQVVLANNVG
jgi:hypothetical protein